MKTDNLKKIQTELEAEGALTRYVDDGSAAFISTLRTSVQEVLRKPKWAGKYITAADTDALVKDVRADLKKRGISQGFEIKSVKGRLEFTVQEKK